MTDKLEPCPFCGGRALTGQNETHSYVFCERCGARTESALDLLDLRLPSAIAYWNRRNYSAEQLEIWAATAIAKAEGAA